MKNPRGINPTWIARSFWPTNTGKIVLVQMRTLRALVYILRQLFNEHVVFCVGMTLTEMATWITRSFWPG